MPSWANDPMCSIDSLLCIWNGERKSRPYPMQNACTASWVARPTVGRDHAARSSPRNLTAMVQSVCGVIVPPRSSGRRCAGTRVSLPQPPLLEAHPRADLRGIATFDHPGDRVGAVVQGERPGRTVVAGEPQPPEGQLAAGTGGARVDVQ